jgi:hypothetical protein
MRERPQKLLLLKIPRLRLCHSTSFVRMSLTSHKVQKLGET